MTHRKTREADPRDYAELAVRDLLSADSVLPEQFWRRHESSTQLSGEHALMWAVFADGVDSYRRYAHAASVEQRAQFAEAEDWIRSTDWEWPFSFVNLCEVFGFDPDGVRDALEHWRQRTRGGRFRRQRFRPVALHAA
jgi:hypothetical protein